MLSVSVDMVGKVGDEEEREREREMMSNNNNIAINHLVSVK